MPGPINICSHKRLPSGICGKFINYLSETDTLKERYTNDRKMIHLIQNCRHFLIIKKNHFNLSANSSTSWLLMVREFIHYIYEHRRAGHCKARNCIQGKAVMPILHIKRAIRDCVTIVCDYSWNSGRECIW